MKKRFSLLSIVALPLLAVIPAISSYASMTNSKVSHNNIDVVNQATQNDVSNYSVIAPSWTHYAVGEKLDLRDLKVTYNDPEKGVIDVTSECKLSKQNNEELTEAGEFDVNIQHNDFNSSFKIYVEKEPTEVPNTNNDAWLCNICVKFKLMSNQECIFTEYEDGKGTLEIPDYIERNEVKYFIKQIPSDWSDGENDITGLKFDENCKHLKKICAHAFENTNCLDWCIKHKDKLLKFPEGLEEIGEYAFSGTDYGQNKIKGYSFPSTLKKIWQKAFSKAPYIDGDDNDGVLEFRSVPEIASDAFYICGAPEHDCKYICGEKQEIAEQMAQLFRNELSDDFNTDDGYLIPQIIYDSIENFTWGDIKVECRLITNECLLNKYVSGSGKMVVPDYVVCNGRNYYIKEIPSNWSRAETNITGLEFECKHLRKICDYAFTNTNCLDYYINHKDQLLKFPEGLEEIGEYAFNQTDCGQNSIKGYSFPSTLKSIKNKVFSGGAPCINGDDNNGELHFKSVPEIHPDAFCICGISKNHCKYIYGDTQEIANKIVDKIKKDMSDDFKISSDYLIPLLTHYAVTYPTLTHYKIGEKLDLRDLKVTYNDIEKGDIDVTSECKLSMQDGQELTQEGEFDVTIQHKDFENSFKIYVEKEPHKVSDDNPYEKMGDITVEYELMSNQECIFTGYKSGNGTLKIPDYVERNRVKYFIKQIPFNWSQCSKNITGLEFECKHLKRICYGAFWAVHCLDEYVNDQNKILEFPEGLEVIEEYAFNTIDCKSVKKIKGYSFPSTLKSIKEYAFNCSPLIGNIHGEGELWFRSTPYIDPNAFLPYRDCTYKLISPLTFESHCTFNPHKCVWVYGQTLDIAKTISDQLRKNDYFSNSAEYLKPRLIGDHYSN